MRPFKTYSLTNFQTCDAVLLTVVAMTYFLTGGLYLWTHFNSQNSMPQQPQIFSLCYDIAQYFCLDCTYKIIRYYFTDHHALKAHAYYYKWQKFLLF